MTSLLKAPVLEPSIRLVAEPSPKASVAYTQQKRKIGIYAGSFNPFHVGHLNIAQKAERLFDKLVIAQGQHPEKSAPECLGNIKALANYEVRQFSGLLTEFIKRDYRKANTEVTIVRGLRNSFDLQAEINLTRAYQDLMPEIEVIHIICDREYEHVSSTLIRELRKYNKAGKYLPE